MKLTHWIKKGILATSAIMLSFVFSTCKEEPIAPPPVKASAKINNAFTTLTNTELFVILQNNNVLLNRITLSRANGVKIIFNWHGNNEGVYGPFSLVGFPEAEFHDGTGRIYRAYNGFLNLSNYRFNNGVYTATGTFEFDAQFQVNDTTALEVKVRDGGFVNVSSQ